MTAPGESSASVAPPFTINIGDRVRTKTTGYTGKRVYGVVEGAYEGAFGPMLTVRITDNGGIHAVAPAGQLHQCSLGAMEPVSTKAEPPLTVTAERYCPPEQVIALVGEECVHCGHEYGLHYENCITRYHDQLTAYGSEQFERLASDLEQVRVLARANWIASLPMVEPGENEADYAARVRMKPPPKNGRRGLWLLGVIDVMLQKGWAGHG